MRIVFAGISAVVAVVLIPLAARGAESPKSERPNPQMMFDRLDKNHDGKITADEASADAPERLKEMLRRADKNNDKVITREEFQEHIKDMGERMRRFGAERRGPGGPRESMERGPRPEGREFGGPPRLPDFKQWFEKWDTNKDKSLSYEEFAGGVKQLLPLIHRHAMGFRGPGAWAYRGGHGGGWSGFGPWRRPGRMDAFGGPWGQDRWHGFGPRGAFGRAHGWMGGYGGWGGGYGAWHRHGSMMGGFGSGPWGHGPGARWAHAFGREPGLAMRHGGERPGAEGRHARAKPSEKNAAPDKGKHEEKKPEANKPEEKKPEGKKPT